jgi:BirA family biotin operon repressor/biotin-[acetyl-CoA-carboxylase] ligase
LTFSVVLRPDLERCRAPLLSLAAALAVVRAADRVAPGVTGAAIKWPNDVLAGEKKICGIICESEGSGARLDWAVLGIGINVNRTRGELPEADSPDRPGATSLRVASGGGECFDIPGLLGAVLCELDGIVRQLGSEPGRAAFAEAYAARCCTLGRALRVVADDGEYFGTAAAIGPGGVLVVDTADGPRAFDAADVVHVRPIL